MLLNAGAERVSFHLGGKRLGPELGADVERHLIQIDQLHEDNFTWRSTIRLTDSTPDQR